MTFVASDVDETLIAEKSMVGLLTVLEETGVLPASAHLVDRVRAQDRRSDANRVYYEGLGGLRVADVERAGRRWFADRSRSGWFWIETAAAVVREAAERGLPVILLSGSLHACLDPIAESLGGAIVVCTELTSIDGVLTGARADSCIGPDKERRLGAEVRRLGLDLTGGLGLGDHVSDHPFLSRCGTGWIVDRGRLRPFV